MDVFNHELNKFKVPNADELRFAIWWIGVKHIFHNNYTFQDIHFAYSQTVLDLALAGF
jgi:hypothetical protein